MVNLVTAVNALMLATPIELANGLRNPATLKMAAIFLLVRPFIHGIMILATIKMSLLISSNGSHSSGLDGNALSQHQTEVPIVKRRPGTEHIFLST